MKITKKCNNSTQDKISKINKLSNKRRSSAGMFYTSSAGAVTSLILKVSNQIIPFGTRVVFPCRPFGSSASQGAVCYRGKRANSRLARLRNVPNSIILITLLSILTTLSYNINSVHATASTINISVVDSVSLNILPNGTTGTFATSDTSTNNISVRTTNGTGYTLGIKASTEGSNALNGANSTSIPSHTVSAGISEATYSTDSTYNNTWGYRPSKLNSTANSNYLPGPTSASSPIELDKTTSANPSTANNYNLAIGVRVDGNTAAGAYSNTFIITVVANPSIYSITYNKNTTDTVSNMPTNVVNQETPSETVTLANNTPTRTGYTFQDWCTVQVADGADCTGTSYSPGGTWTIDQTAASNSLTLYARWKASCQSTISGYIQDVSAASTYCDDASGTVTDRRDNNTYTVKKINGQIWMTQNLRFQGTSIDSTTTNINTTKTLTWYDLDGTEGSSKTGYCYGGINTSTWSWEGKGFSYACKHDSGNATTGVWYNFAGASAMTITGVSNSNPTSYDICPKNWHLPTGPNTTADTDYNKLVGNTTSGYQDPTPGLIAFGAVNGGYYSVGSLVYTELGQLWSSSVYDKNMRHYSVYNSNSGQFNGGALQLRYIGSFVRCVRS